MLGWGANVRFGLGLQICSAVDIFRLNDENKVLYRNVNPETYFGENWPLHH